MDDSNKVNFSDPVFMAITDYVFKNYDLDNGTQYLIIIYVADSSKRAIGTIFAEVMTTIGVDGCMVFPIYYTDFGNGAYYEEKK